MKKKKKKRGRSKEKKKKKHFAFRGYFYHFQKYFYEMLQMVGRSNQRTWLKKRWKTFILFWNIQFFNELFWKWVKSLILFSFFFLNFPKENREKFITPHSSKFDQNKLMCVFLILIRVLNYVWNSVKYGLNANSMAKFVKGLHWLKIKGNVQSALKIGLERGALKRFQYMFVLHGFFTCPTSFAPVLLCSLAVAKPRFSSWRGKQNFLMRNLRIN